MPKIIATIDKLGNAKIEVEGESGSGCVERTQSVEAALAGDLKRTTKPEYDEVDGAATSGEQVQTW